VGRVSVVPLLSAWRRLAPIIIVNDVSFESAAKVADEIKTMKHKAIALKADVSLPSDVAKMIEDAQAVFGKIDILVNNAGITRDQL